jgi:hypothetical protein
MSPVLRYRNIVTALGEARRDAAEMRDREIETRLRDLQAVAIDRLYAALDHASTRPVPIERNTGKGRALSSSCRQLSPGAVSNLISGKILEA